MFGDKVYFSYADIFLCTARAVYIQGINMKKYLSFIIALASLYFTPNSYAEKEIALTIDDLPFVGSSDSSEGNIRRARERFLNILASLREQHIPATGFIIAGAIGKGQWELLEEFRNEGFS